MKGRNHTTTDTNEFTANIRKRDNYSSGGPRLQTGAHAGPNLELQQSFIGTFLIYGVS